MVDDEPYVLDLIEVVLKMDGHDLSLARNGQEGLRKFASGSFDIVVTDFNMPLLNGLEMAQGIRALDRNVKIILMSGAGERVQEDGGLPACVDLTLAKPLRVNTLKEVLSKLQPLFSKEP